VRAHWNRINDWLDHRTGVHTAVRKFLYEDIPASSGWHQVFGSVGLFLFLVQAFTGALLAFNYAPTPGDAYNSLRYILTELTGGRLMRGLHHWGASLMITVVVLHMIQVFLFGAYKKPRFGSTAWRRPRATNWFRKRSSIPSKCSKTQWPSSLPLPFSL